MYNTLKLKVNGNYSLCYQQTAYIIAVYITLLFMHLNASHICSVKNLLNYKSLSLFFEASWINCDVRKMTDAFGCTIFGAKIFLRL